VAAAPRDNDERQARVELVRLLRGGHVSPPARDVVGAQNSFVEGDALRLEREPRSFIGANDLHLISLEAGSGRILCYAALRPLADPPPSATLRTLERPLFPVEETFGWGVFNGLRVLPDLPVARIRELKRFVKNQSLRGLDELGVRAPIELLAGLVVALTSALNREVDAFIGDLEQSVAKRNFDYFHAPVVVLPGALAYANPSDYLHPHFRDSEAVPFATLVSDLFQIVPDRVAAITAALALPGKQRVLALLRLRDVDMPADRSSTLLPGDDASLLTTALRDVEGPLAMDERWNLREAGERVRGIEAFASLSPQEAVALRAHMKPVQAQPGDAIVRRLQPGDALYLIETGTVAIEIDRPDRRVRLATLGPGDYFGEIALVTGAARTADVVALTPASLMQLDRTTYARYLAEHARVGETLARTAASRAAFTQPID
jgi:hypothetical protein